MMQSLFGRYLSNKRTLDVNKMAVEFEKFEITDQDLEDEFNINRWRPRLSKNQQIYGIWADPDSDEEPRKPGYSKKSYSGPINFVGGGVQQAGKNVENEEEDDDIQSVHSDSSDEVEIVSVKYPSRFGQNKSKRFASVGNFGPKPEQFGGWEEHTKGFGGKLLLKMGYQPGKGLGRDLQGITNPIEAKLRKGRGAIGLYGAEHVSRPVASSDVKQIDDKRVKPWQKKSEDSKRRVKKTFKTPEDVIAEGSGRRLPGDRSQLSNVKVIDLTGPEQRILSGYHAIHQQHNKPSEQDDEKSSVKVYRNFDLPELGHNLDILIDLTEDEIIRNDRELRHDKDMVINLEHEEGKLNEVLDEEKKQIKTMERILEIIEGLEERTTTGCANPLTLKECTDIFRRLQDEFYEEYKISELANLAVSVVGPILTRHLSSWDPLKDSTYPLDLIQEWKDILDNNSTHRFESTEMGPYQKLIWDVWMPRVREAVSKWNCRDCVPMIELLEHWMPLLPRWIMDNILDQLILPKLQQEVEEWNPLQDRMYIHVWLHPWLPLMGTRLEPLYGPIRHKLSCAMVNWHPCDDSAKKILMPWKQVFPPGVMEMWVEKNIYPKLENCLQGFVINPHEQHLEPWHWVMAWDDFLPTTTLVTLLDRHFFPKWLNVLCCWLGRKPMNEEVTQWYFGWKSMFSEKLLSNPTIKERFDHALHVMNHAIDLANRALDINHVIPGGYQPGAKELAAYLSSLERQRELNAATLERQRELNVGRNYEAIAQAVRSGGSSAANMAPTFKDMIERKSRELGVIFMPVPNRYQEAKQVHRFGNLLLYIDRGVIFVQNGNNWVPKSLESIVEMCR